VPEIQNLADATERINTHYKVDSAQRVQDYAKIALFLSDRPRFEEALNGLSRTLWEIYRRKAPSPNANAREYQTSGERNKFTDALRIAGRNHGFGLDEHSVVDTTNVVLVGAISAEDYLGRIKRGLFFKDMMDLAHGEHSHTLQWLTIATGNLGLAERACDLYKGIYEVRPRKNIVVPGFKLTPRSREQGARKDVSFWSWLVDCFPVSSAQGSEIPAAESLFTDGYRCPQNLMRYLMDMNDETHFLSVYLTYRYQRRNFFRPNEQGYEAISKGNTSKDYGKQSQSAIPGIKVLAGNDGSAAGFERAGPQARYTAKELGAKKFKVVKLHGVEGVLTDPTSV